MSLQKKGDFKEKIKIGDKVQFICRPYGYYGKDGSSVILCEGFVEEIKQSTFGSRRKGLGAKILVSTDEYVRHYRGKKRAFISLKNITKIK